MSDNKTRAPGKPTNNTLKKGKKPNQIKKSAAPGSRKPVKKQAPRPNKAERPTKGNKKGIAATKNNRKKRSKGPKKKFTWKKALLGVAIAGLAGVIAGLTLMIIWMAQAPPLDLSKFEFSSATHLVDSKGKFYQELQGEENREPVTGDEIPELVQLAFISIEDRRYYEHNGVDIIGTGKAILKTFTSGSLDGPGGSTITQQLIKLTHLTSETAVKRKVMEWKLSIDLESKLSKEQILEAYLNKVNMSQAWGIQAGSRYFFNKDVGELTVAQAAVLASIINAPTYYNPIKYVEDKDTGEYKIATVKNADGKKVVAYDDANKERSLAVVAAMYELGHINEKEYEIAKDELENNKIGLKKPKNNGYYSYFTDAVYTQLVSDIKEKYNYTEEDASAFILNNGLTIKSTVDSDIQTIMEKTAKKDSIFPSQSYSASAASAAMTKKTGEEVNYNPEVGMAIVENGTGKVVGLLGGRDKKGSLSMNRALRKFQPGSSTKPLTTYGPGVDSGQITMGTAFDDNKISVGGWRPGNAGGGNKGMTTCRKGLASSTNTIAVQAMMQTTPEVIKPYAEKLGLDILTEPDENGVSDMNPAALALGGYTHGQTPLAMASAYTVFQNGGVRNDPILYTEVLDSSGEVILSNKQKETKVFDAGTAYIVSDVLKEVVKGGTTYISLDGAEVAGKTGTTDKNMHAWFCGFTKEYSGAVWYGYDENVVTVKGNTYNLNIGTYGGSTNGPAAFWKETFSSIYSKKKIKNSSFAEKPSNVYSAAVDGVSGKSPTALSSKDPRGSKVYSELFLEGKGLNGKDDYHVEQKTCGASNEVATQYCPTNLVKKAVVIKLPPDRYPPGVTGPKDTSPGIDKKHLATKTKCSIHNSETPAKLVFTQNGRTVSSTSVNAGQSINLVVKGVTSGGDTTSVSGVRFSKGNGNISYSSSGSSVNVSGVSGGQSSLTATYSVGSGSSRYSVSASVNISVSGTSASPDLRVYINGNESTYTSVGIGDSTPSISARATDGSTGQDISSSISRSITNGSGSSVGSISTARNDTFTITFSVTGSNGRTTTKNATVVVGNGRSGSNNNKTPAQFSNFFRNNQGRSGGIFSR